MAQLKFAVENQIITREDGFNVVAKSIYYLFAEFTFSEDWGDGIKTAQFVNSVDGEPHKVILNPDGTCVVPWEALKYDNSKIKVSVFSGNRITTNEATVIVQKSGYMDPGSEPQPPTPGVYEQILKRLEGLNDADIRVSSLTDTVLVSSKIIEAVGNPIYIDDVAEYSAYGITESGWYVFARISTKEGTVVTASTTVEGAAGYIATIGADHIDVAVKFEVAAVSQPVVINWGSYSETFAFKATDLAIRNLDYRVTFYVYDIDEFATWEYALTTDTTFADGKYYYTKDEDDNYTLAEVTVGDPVPADTYYVHSHVTFEGMARNITYRCNTVIDCPMTFILPEIEDDCHGCWFEIRFRHAGAYSSTLVPPEGVKVATEHTQGETAGMNMVNLHYSSVGGAKVWRFMNTHSTIPA